MQELDEFINQVKQLPPAPKVLPELLALLNRPNIDASKVVKLIAYDPGLSVRFKPLIGLLLVLPAMESTLCR